MSRSNNVDLVNPAKMFFEWNGEKGHFRYWDKEAVVEGQEKPGKNIDVLLPFAFMALDSLSTIKGFSDADNSSFWSNEVRNVKTDEMIVRTKKGICAKGIYEKVIVDRNCNGAKYCQSVYIAYRTAKDNPMVIANIQLTGAALSSWIDFRKKNKNIFEGAIIVKGCVQGQKGKVVYQMPIFQKLAVTPQSEKDAIELDKELQKYLSAYLKRNNETVAEANITESAGIQKEVESVHEDLINDDIIEQHDENYSFPDTDSNNDFPF